MKVFFRDIARYTVITAAFHTCAMPSPPSGGDRDKTPPQILKASTEQASIHFSEASMTWTFDEFVTLNSPRQNMRCNPPLPGEVEYLLRGKKFTIRWDGELEPNTTYNLQWGNTIKDLHEGNVLSGLTWVWSTGATLDSGHVESQWNDALSGQPIQDLAVNLYPLDAGDSCVFGQPTYTSRTNDSGNAVFHFVKPGEYLIRSFLDPDGNNTLSVGETSPIGSGFIETGQKVALKFAQSDMPQDSAFAWTPGHEDSCGTLQLTLRNSSNRTQVIKLKQDGLRLGQWILEASESIDSTLVGLPPGSYQLESWQVIGGRIDSLQLGNYWKHMPADQRTLWPDAIEIKAGWEHQIDWAL